MANLYQLAQELDTTPQELKTWLKARGLGAGKSISSRAAREARAHFADIADHPMADALNDRDGLGAVARHEELTQVRSGIKVEERPQRKWGKVERSDVDIAQLDMHSQKDFFRQLRQGPSSTSSSSASQPPLTPSDSPKPSSSNRSAQTSRSSSSSPDHPKKTSPSLASARTTSRQAQRRRPNLEDTKNSVFDSLAPLAHQLDSVTDRTPASARRSNPESDAQALRALSEGVDRLTHKGNTSKRKSKRSKKSKRGHQSPPPTAQVTAPTTPHHHDNVSAAPQHAPSISPPHAPSSTRSSEPTFQELFERPQNQSQQSKLQDLRASLRDLTRERDALRDELDRRDQALRDVESVSSTTSESRESSRSHSLDPTTPAESAGLIWDHLSAFGLNATQARLALLELLDHPQRGPELVYSLKHDTPKMITRGFAIVCSAEVCQEVAEVNARQGLIELEERHLCSICQGSDSRGWYRRLLLTATHTQRDRILVVGGDDGDYSQIKQLARQYPGLSWDFIAGSTRLSQTVANAKVTHKAAVILWGGVHLPHALSNLVKSAADRTGVPCFALEPGTRSVATLCREVLRSWGVSYE